MLHFYPVKRIYHSRHLDLSVEVNESMDSNDHEKHSRPNGKGLCWNCFPCFRSLENNDSLDPHAAPKPTSSRIPNYQSHRSNSRPQRIERYHDNNELWSDDDNGGFSRSCPAAVTQQPRQLNERYQRDSRHIYSPALASAQSPQGYSAVPQVPKYADHQINDPRVANPPMKRSHIDKGATSRKQEAKPRSERPKYLESWTLPEGRESEVVHRSPTREEPPISSVKREKRTQRASSEYVPKGQIPIDGFSGDSSSAVYCDISAVRSSAYSSHEVSPGSQTMPEPSRPILNVSRNMYSKQQPFLSCKVESMPIQSRVRFVGEDGRFIGGTITWTGIFNNDFSVRLAVVRLDQFSSDAGNGVFHNQKLVNQIENNRYLLKDVQELLSFSLQEGDYCYVIYGPKDITNRKGFLRNRSQTSYELHPVDTLYTEPLTNISRFPDYFLNKIPTPVSDDISNEVGPITLAEFDSFLGRNKGIQGKLNSCYLDTLLFSVFAFSSDLDDFLFNNHSSMVVSHLRHSIILPLRACHFVADAQVEYLRQTLSRETNNPKFETEARDIPECLEALFGSILRIPPPLHIGSANFFNATFAIETFCPDNIRVPTFQDFLDHSSVLMDFCFREIPKYFFLQFPREAYHSSIVIPSLELEVNDVLHRSVKECFSCGRNATLQFPELAQAGGLKKSFFCRKCAAQRGLNEAAARELPEPAVPDGEEPDSRLVLTAVLCIELSHYNCFARCQDRWVFFDSMSDQEEMFDPLLGKSVTFNIPAVRSVPDFVDVIYGASQSLKENGSLDKYLAGLPEEHLVRLFKCAYIAIYSQARHF